MEVISIQNTGNTKTKHEAANAIFINMRTVLFFSLIIVLFSYQPKLNQRKQEKG